MIPGASRMIGSTLFNVLSANSAPEIFGMLRSATNADYFHADLCSHFLPVVNIVAPDALAQTNVSVGREVVINCKGVTEYVAGGNASLSVISMNVLLPHRIAMLFTMSGTRLIQVPTDGVCSGDSGAYCETDKPDVTDVQGRSKRLGRRHHRVRLANLTLHLPLISAQGKGFPRSSPLRSARPDNASTYAGQLPAKGECPIGSVPQQTGAAWPTDSGDVGW